MRPSVCASGARLFLWTLLLTLTAAAHAAKFDEKTKAPRSADAADFKRHVRDYFAAYERFDKSNQAGELIRDRATYSKWFDVHWCLGRAMDEGVLLGDLSELGLERKEDGSYTARAKTHPQWMPIDLMLISWRTPGVFDSYAADLKERGFRDQDLAVLKNYIDSNNWERAELAENKPLTESFASTVQFRHRARRAMDTDQTMSFVYQRSRNSREAIRAWAVGLLDTLDRQRQRILVSYIQEFDASRTYGPPSSSMQEQLDRTVAPLISGEYVEMLQQQETRIRQ